jgi:hypothetical protein
MKQGEVIQDENSKGKVRTGEGKDESKMKTKRVNKCVEK